MQEVYATDTASISDLKKNPSEIVKRARRAPVAILNHNRPTAYLVSLPAFEAMIQMLDDLTLAQFVIDRQKERSIRMPLDEL